MHAERPYCIRGQDVRREAVADDGYSTSVRRFEGGDDTFQALGLLGLRVARDPQPERRLERAERRRAVHEPEPAAEERDRVRLLRRAGDVGVCAAQLLGGLYTVVISQHANMGSRSNQRARTK